MADHVSMTRTPKATREYIERIEKTVWDDGVKAGRSGTDPEWYVWYMEGFLSEQQRAAYELIDRIEDEQKEERNGV